MDSEIQKYANRLTVLNNLLGQQKYTKNIEKKIEKCTTRLSISRKNKELFEQDYRSYCMNQKPEPIAQVVQAILESPFSDLVATTRFSGENDFLTIDEKNGNVKLWSGFPIDYPIRKQKLLKEYHIYINTTHKKHHTSIN